KTDACADELCLVADEFEQAFAIIATARQRRKLDVAPSFETRRDPTATDRKHTPGDANFGPPGVRGLAPARRGVNLEHHNDVDRRPRNGASDIDQLGIPSPKSTRLGNKDVAARFVQDIEAAAKKLLGDLVGHAVEDFTVPGNGVRIGVLADDDDT